MGPCTSHSKKPPIHNFRTLRRCPPPLHSPVYDAGLERPRFRKDEPAGRAQSSKTVSIGPGKGMDEATTIYRDSGSGVASAVAPILTVIVPTLNERDNIEPLVALLISAMPSTAWEAIFVDDDSPDGTSERVRALARHNPRIRCLQRLLRPGRGTACISGV